MSPSRSSMASAGDREGNVHRGRGAALLLGVIGSAALLTELFFNAGGFFHAYLVGYLFWLGTVLGCLSWLMIHHLTGGHWGWALRRPAEVAISTLPLFVIGFLPLVWGFGFLYPWAAHAPEGVSQVLEHQRLYLNMPLVLVRAVIYFGTWIICGGLLLRPSARAGHAQPAAAIGLVLMFLTITFAAIDWLLAIEAGAFSSIWGLYVGIGFATGGLGWLLWVVAWPIRHVAPQELGKARTILLRDLGNLLLACVVLHAYMDFSQFFITWNGNTQAEIPWYVTRVRGCWGALAIGLILLYFFLPFWALLFRFVKAHPRLLISVSAVLMASQALGLMWMVLPGMNPQGHWSQALIDMAMSSVAIIGLGGWFMAAVAWQWGRMPEPLNRPQTALNPREVTP